MKVAALLLTIFVFSFPQITYAKATDQSDPTQREAAKEELMMKRQEVKETIKENRMEAKADWQAKKEAFKEKLKTLKDERKKAKAEQLDTNLATINKNRTDVMTANVTRLTSILSLIETKKDEAKAGGKDVASAEIAITAAQTALEAAQAAVTAQAAKDYTATVTDETTLRESFLTQLTQLKADLKATHKTVAAAKEAVRAAAKSLRQLEGVGTSPSAAPVPSQ